MAETPYYIGAPKYFNVQTRNQVLMPITIKKQNNTSIGRTSSTSNLTPQSNKAVK
jgi:hypothetical protein